MGEAESTALRETPPRRSGIARRRSRLTVEPDAAGPVVTGPLAPDGDALSGRRDGDLAVVAVWLGEATGRLVRGAARRIGDTDRAGPGRPVAGRQVVDVPRVDVSTGRLHVPGP